MAVSTGTAILGSAGIGAAAGLLGNRGRQSGTVNTTGAAFSEPWWAVQPYLQDAFSRGQTLLGQPAIGAQSPYTQQAIAEQARLATSPGLISSAQQELADTIGGRYLDPSTNPYLQAAGQNAINQALAGVSSRFSGENYGSSPNREWMTRAATEAVSPFYFGQYGQERGRQFAGLSMAPGLQFANVTGLGQAGALEEARAQAEVDAPWTQLARYRGLLTGVPGGSTTSQQQQPYFTNPWASALGGGLLGAQLYNQFLQQQPQNYGSFMENAWQSGFGPAFSQQGIYG